MNIIIEGLQFKHLGCNENFMMTNHEAIYTKITETTYRIFNMTHEYVCREDMPVKRVKILEVKVLVL